MKKSLKIFLLILGGLLVFYFSGSSPDKFEVNPTIEIVPSAIETLDAQVATMEAKFDTRSGNEAKIVWADTNHTKTDYALVYLHGFSASHMEGNPVHRALAKRYGMNLYLSRLHEHGLISDHALENFGADDFVESCKIALQIGQQLGDEVIVMGTSTGATAAIYLAAFNPELLDILILYAPNINVADPRSFLLTYPWGQQLAEFLEGDFLKQGMSSIEFNKYWNPTYRTSSVVELLSLIEHTMTDDVFIKIKQPTLISYFYKNEQEHDNIISVDRIQDFYNGMATPESKKRLRTTPNSGNHVTISNITSKDVLTPFNQACMFLEEICELPIVDSIRAELLLGLE